MEKEFELRNRTQHRHDCYSALAKSRLRLQNTRKLDCPAEIQIRGVKIFVDYCVEIEKCATMNSLTMDKRTILKQLEKKIGNQSDQRGS